MRSVFLFVMSLLGLAAVIGIAYGLDTWIENLRSVSFPELGGTGYWLVPAYIADLILAGLLFAWFWFVRHEEDGSFVLAIIYTAVGLGTLFYNLLIVTLASRLPLPMQLSITPKSLTAFSSAFIAIVGLQRLLFGHVSE